MADSASKRRDVRTRLRSVRRGDTAAAVRCAAWLGIIYKASSANFTAAHGWLTPAKTVNREQPTQPAACLDLAGAGPRTVICQLQGLLTEQALQLHAQ